MRVWMLALLLVPLAGCFGDDEPAGIFTYTAPDDPLHEPFMFEAQVPGDRFVWDFGDGRAPKEGQQVAHTFGAAAGSTIVRLTAYEGEIERRYDGVRIDVGPGENTPPELVMHVAHDWVQVDESVVLTGAPSVDPDGDALLFQWSCRRLSDIVPKTDDHAPAPTPAVGEPIPVTVLRESLALETQDLGALCGGLPGHYQEAATVEGRVAEPGIYLVEMRAKDPTGTSRVGSWQLYVTDVARPEGVTVHAFNGSRDLAYPAAAPPDLVDDRNQHTFRIPFDAASMHIDLSPDGGTSGQNVTYRLLAGPVERVQETWQDVLLPANKATSADYTLEVFLRDGVDVDYSFTVTVQNDLDPSNFWTGPH